MSEISEQQKWVLEKFKESEDGYMTAHDLVAKTYAEDIPVKKRPVANISRLLRDLELRNLVYVCGLRDGRKVYSLDPPPTISIGAIRHHEDASPPRLAKCSANT